jgi:hypothetical protein
MSFLDDLLSACFSCLRRLQPNAAQPGRRTHALFRYDINMPRLEPARPIFNSSGPNSDGSSYRLNMSSSLFPPFAELPLRESMSSFTPNRKRKDARTHTRANNNAASNRTRYFLGTVGMVFLSSALWLNERLIRLLFADQVRDKTGKSFCSPSTSRILGRKRRKSSCYTNQAHSSVSGTLRSIALRTDRRDSGLRTNSLRMSRSVLLVSLYDVSQTSFHHAAAPSWHILICHF